jgi:hypothetical protein
MRLIVLLSTSVIFSVLLSGCLVSKAPLITTANSDRPLPAHFILSDEENPANRATVNLEEDNSYFVSFAPIGAEQSDRVEERLRFKRVADNIYASSRPEIDKDTGKVDRYVYGYMRVIDSNRISIYEVLCSDFDPVEAKKLGAEVIEPGGYSPSLCAVPSIEVLESLIRNYLSRPDPIGSTYAISK